MSLENELTSSELWDETWKRKKVSGSISSKDPILGSNGAFIRSIKKHIKITKGYKIIELGGACSSYLCCLSKFESIAATAIDYSEIGIKKTHELFKSNKVKVVGITSDLFSHNFNNEKYDMVVHFGLIEHFNDPTSIFTLSYNLLNEHGSIFMTMPNMDAIGTYLWKKYDKEDLDCHIYHTDNYIIKIASEAGFDTVSVNYWGAPPLV